MQTRNRVQARSPSPVPSSPKRKRDLTDDGQRSENNDYCSACHGSGYLLCCDGCDRSFHFTCLDPPLNGNAKELDEPWYCFTCVANRPPMLESPEKAPTTSATRIFAPLLGSLKRRNPKNFELPQELREYFEGVATDKNGSFMEALNNKPTRYATTSAPLLHQLTLYSETAQATPMSSQITPDSVIARVF